MPTFQDARDGLDALLKDGKGNLTGPEKDQHLRLAAKTFQGRFPRVIAKEVTGDGGFEYTLPSDYVDGFSKINAIFYPWVTTEQDPEPLEANDYNLWDGPSGLRLRFRADNPQAAEKFLMQFTAPHTIGENVDVAAALAAAGTVVAGATVTGVADVSKAADAQVFIHVTAVVGADAALEAFVQASADDGAHWTDIAAFNPITAVGDYTIPLAKEQVSRSIRVRFVPSAGSSFTLEAKVTSEDTAGVFTVPDHLMDVYLYLTASISAQALADFYAGLLDNQLQGDSTDYEGKSTFWQANADAWREKWEATRDEKAPTRGTAASSQGEWDLRGTGGWAYLTHRERDR